jgi:hypothetical protein
MAGKGGKAWIFFATLMIVCGVGAYAMVTGRAPKLKEASQAVAATVASIAASYAAVPPAPDAGEDAAGTPPPRKQAGPLSNAQLGAPLVHGTFVSACGAPDDMKVTVKASVRAGHATTVTVKTTPDNPTVGSCIEQAVRGMQWDISPKTGKVTVNY